MRGFPTLKRSREFDLAYSGGAKSHASTLILFYRPLKERRVGLTVSKKVGNAVRRNFVRRRLRAVYRRYAPCLKEGALVIVAKNAILEADFATLERDFIHATKRLRIFQNLS